MIALPYIGKHGFICVSVMSNDEEILAREGLENYAPETGSLFSRRICLSLMLDNMNMTK